MQSMGKRKHREEKGGQDAWKGSYTVEAAVILPLTALILAAVILAAFYIHDRSCMQGMACEIASAGSKTAALFGKQKSGCQCFKRKDRSKCKA